MELERKTLTLELKQDEDAPEGSFRAIFSTFDVIDHDGDRTEPGAFADGAEVRISAYNHSSWGGVLPVGKGTIHQDNQKAWVDGQFFIDLPSGREHYEVVKRMGSLAEWSYGFNILAHEFAEEDGREVRILKDIDVFEVSPVLLGAGIDTRTEWIKARRRDEEPDEKSDPPESPEASTDDGASDDDLVRTFITSFRSADGREWAGPQLRFATLEEARAAAEPVGLDVHGELVEEGEIPLPLKEGLRFVDDGARAVDRLRAFVLRAVDLGAMRAEKGKGFLSEGADEAVQSLLLAMDEAKASLLALTATSARSGATRQRATRTLLDLEEARRSMQAHQ